MKSVFVTGTDTAVGKTLVTLTLMQAWQERGLSVAGMKPVAAGVVAGIEEPRNDDALAILHAGSVAIPYEIVNPFCFTEPVAPHIAAEEENTPIDTATIKRAYEEICAKADCVVVEGAGGWLVPTSSSHTMADLVVELELSVLLVVGLRLGCLNHTLLTAESIERSGCNLIGWIGCHLRTDFPKAEQNIITLRDRLGAPCFGIFPFQENVVANDMVKHLESLPFE
ncbi:MAG: dethiobiotin synthase [Gammaproteobacteria bacterium]